MRLDALSVPRRSRHLVPVAPLRMVVQCLVGGVAILALAGSAIAGVFAYPQKGRSPAQQQETRSAYDRAFAACMEGRGYTVR